MYSGITQGLFFVSHVDKKPGLIRYTVAFNAALVEGLHTGASMNIDGVCQTVEHIEGFNVTFSAMAETLRLTTLKDLTAGRKISGERSLRYGEEIGGHLIAGHIIGTATVDQVIPQENNLSLRVRCPAEWMKFILPKGFIAVEGSSLTVGETDPAGFFFIHLIPETLRATNFGEKKVGDLVNIELDPMTQLIVTTVERILNN